MTWLVFGVSCLLVLAGAVSIISGAPIIQLERGWAEVIAGTVALSSGGIVFALAGILMRLESIRDTLASRSLPVAAESITTAVADPLPATERGEALPPVPSDGPEPGPTPPVVQDESASDPVAPPLAAPAPPVDDGRSQGLWKRVKRPEEKLQVAEKRQEAEDLLQHGFPDRVLPDVEREVEATDKPVLVPSHSLPPAPAPVESSPKPSEPTPQDEAQIGWLERSLFKGRPPRPASEPSARTEPPIGRPSSERIEERLEPMVVPLVPARPAAPSVSAPEPTAAAEPDPTPDLASEQHQGATVVGRYQAGSASYVMYSDGTIEVETESGELHRFESMEELKAFIAQQDSTVS